MNFRLVLLTAFASFASFASAATGWGGEQPRATVTRLPESLVGDVCGEIVPDSDTLHQVFVDSVHAGGYSACGAWVEIDGPAAAGASPRRIRAKVVGFYPMPPDTGAHLDVYGTKAWTGLVGAGSPVERLTGVAWRFVEAPVGDAGIVVRLRSSTNAFFAVVEVLRHRLGVTRLEVSTKPGTWTTLPRNVASWWTWTATTAALPTTFSIRLTDVLGRTVEDQVSLRTYAEGVSDTLSVQFPQAAPVGIRRQLGAFRRDGRVLVVRDLRGALLERRTLAEGESARPTAGGGPVTWTLESSRGIEAGGVRWVP